MRQWEWVRITEFLPCTKLGRGLDETLDYPAEVMQGLGVKVRIVGRGRQKALEALTEDLRKVCIEPSWYETERYDGSGVKRFK